VTAITGTKPTKLKKRPQADVGDGSFLTELGCPRHVRFTPGRDRGATSLFGSFVPNTVMGAPWRNCYTEGLHSGNFGGSISEKRENPEASK
jgi:hypothetical protein